MKFRRKLFLATAVLSAVAAMISCKKDEETGTSQPSLDNVPRFEVDSYVKCGTKVKLTPTKVTNPTGAEVKYKWSITRGSDTVMSSRESEEDDGMSLEFVFEGAVAKDTLCNFIITCAAEATGYYGTSFSKVVTTVSEESLVSEGDAPELAYDITTGTITADDGKTAYGTIKAGGLEWLAENIHFSGTAGAVTGVALEEAEDASDIFGRFYTWDEAQTACASLGTEWRVPAISDWDSFLTMLMDGEGDSQSGTEDSPVVWEGVTGKLMTNAFFNGVRMWEYWPDVDITNETGFGIIPTGLATVVDNSSLTDGASGNNTDRIYSFTRFGEYAGFWVGEEYPQKEDSAYYLYFWDENPNMRLNYVDKGSLALPVRCVRDI